MDSISNHICVHIAPVRSAADAGRIGIAAAEAAPYTNRLAVIPFYQLQSLQSKHADGHNDLYFTIQASGS